MYRRNIIKRKYKQSRKVVENKEKKSMATDIRTLKQLAEKYDIPYDTLYKEIVKKNTIPFIRFGGIRVSESTFRSIFMEKGFAI